MYNQWECDKRSNTLSMRRSKGWSDQIRCIVFSNLVSQISEIICNEKRKKNYLWKSPVEVTVNTILFLNLIYLLVFFFNHLIIFPFIPGEAFCDSFWNTHENYSNFFNLAKLWVTIFYLSSLQKYIDMVFILAEASKSKITSHFHFTFFCL